MGYVYLHLYRCSLFYYKSAFLRLRTARQFVASVLRIEFQQTLRSDSHKKSIYSLTCTMLSYG
jgi:hypothetical protein